MSDVELLEASGPWWSPILAAVLIALFLAACWTVVHPRLTWNFLCCLWRHFTARHRSASLYHLTFKAPVR